MPGVVQPGGSAELASFIAAAAAARTPVSIEGAGSKAALGRPVDAASTISLGKMTGVTMYEPGELVFTALAGTPLDDIEAMLDAQGQRLAFEPPDWRRLMASDAPHQTLGGVVASNLSGSARLSAGAARDHFIGLQAVNGLGQLIKSGGRVVKNVSGYDSVQAVGRVIRNARGSNGNHHAECSASRA